ncbi:hypothetical protein J2J97_32460 (plasmid) [Rhizobium bangladeshense]|uniref:hypothetical protein n=1 Tax=Rhizobium bangladeshense TaxID=1138189 RepID=UPI001A98C44E|nr:hypothetical protein [Rhizobium bangladeshense]QSY98619.1 hypothetical protein J2J97_32460 [Rhizobium bangladeshense]
MSLINSDFGIELVRGGPRMMRAALPVSGDVTPPGGGARLLVGADIFAMSGDQSTFDLGIAGSSDKQLEDMVLMLEPSGREYAVVATATGTRRITINDIKDLLEI